jgi:hypothetical protein
MMFEDYYEANPSRGDFWYLLRWCLLVAFLVFLLFLALHAMGVIGTVATAPGRVINKTLDTDNILTTYEWFFDTNAQYESRLSQIKAHAVMLKEETDPKERTRLSVELAAMRQSCRDLATKYNANADKANKAVFKTQATPQSVAPNACEA